MRFYARYYFNFYFYLNLSVSFSHFGFKQIGNFSAKLFFRKEVDFLRFLVLWTMSHMHTFLSQIDDILFFFYLYYNLFQFFSNFKFVFKHKHKQFQRDTTLYVYSNQYILFLLEINNNELQNFKTKKKPYACLIRTVIYYILLILRDYRRLQELQNLDVWKI